MRCPPAALARACGGPGGFMGNNLVPEIYAKYTLRTFGSILFIGLLLSILNLLESDVVTV
jgi:hypothetical protein